MRSHLRHNIPLWNRYLWDSLALLLLRLARAYADTRERNRAVHFHAGFKLPRPAYPWEYCGNCAYEQMEREA